MARVSPHLHRAEHFRVYAEKLEQAVGGGLRLCFAAPPQHGKTQVTLHGLAWLIVNHPGKRHAYITYSLYRARSVARMVKRILADAGIVCGGTLSQMLLPKGGQCVFTSIDGGITGEPVDGVAIIDDPYKNRKEADSQVRRQVIEDSYRQAIETRVHDGASIFLLATRWHPQDLSGTLVEEGWEYINLPAIAEANDNGKPDPNGREVGEPLFPQLWSLASLLSKQQKVGEFTWSALYQGRPRPRGGKIFKGTYFYSKLPTEGYRGAFGVDLAYTEKSKSDWSVCIELLRVDKIARDGSRERPKYYVKHVDRDQVEAPDFALTLRARHVQHKTFPMLWRASGTEKGSAQFIKKHAPLRVVQPPGDKIVSATEAAALWNAGDILVPDPEHFPHCEVWLYAFLGVLHNFTGSGKEKDDDVDALGNAVLALDGDGDHSPVTGKSARK
jgi:phage terminase large subunit-like protein